MVANFSSNCFNSSFIFSKSSKGSLPSQPLISTIWTNTFVLWTCLKKSKPSPTPSDAPSINPGISAITNDVPFLRLATPRLGTNVVKW